MSQPRRTRFVPQLGLVCITSTDAVRYRTITRTRFLSLSASNQLCALRDLYSHNLERLFTALEFCDANDIRLYRVTSGLFPMDDAPAGDVILNELAPRMRRFGKLARRLEIRVVMHPDQFVVLSSDSPAIVEASVRILTRQSKIFDLLGLPRSPWAALIVHGGKRDRADRLVQTVQFLPHSARKRLVLENDEICYSATQILDVCRRAGVPMVFDAHHHAVREKLDSYEHRSFSRMTRLARATWPDPSWQLAHISNGCDTFLDPRHSDTITSMPSAFASVPWIEVEAKLKEQAITRLRANWKPLARRRQKRKAKLAER